MTTISDNVRLTWVEGATMTDLDGEQWVIHPGTVRVAFNGRIKCRCASVMV